MTTVGQETIRQDRPGGAIAASLTGLFFAMVLLPRSGENPVVFWSMLGAAAGLLSWQLLLLMRARRRGRGLDVRVVLRKPHYVQALVHTGIFAYWGWHWPEVYHFGPLIVAQIVFAYVFDMLLCWSRRRTYFLGFGPFPIVLSTNLFLWFKDDWFFLQFAMIATIFLGKEFLRWNRDGQRVHIFNPSAFALAAFSAVLILTGSSQITWGLEIATRLLDPDYIYLEIFLLGLVVQYLFSVTLVTFAAAVVLCVLGIAYSQVTGVYFFVDSGIPIAVFLGLHLLVTDPATSPRSDLGRVMFGALYGAGVFVLYGVLEELGAPTFYDKLLCVPLLNLAVPLIDRVARAWQGQHLDLGNLGLRLRPGQANLVHMAAWIVFFASVNAAGIVGKEHEGRDPAFWQEACRKGLRGACESLTMLLSGYCGAGSGPACYDLGQRLIREDEEAARRGGVESLVRACDLGYQPGCANLAALMVRGGGPAALTMLRGGCQSGDGKSCYLLGTIHENGIGVAADRAQALGQMRSACDLGWTLGCRNLVQGGRAGDAAHADDLRRAVLGLTKACDAGDPAGCADLGTMYSRGYGVPASPAQAEELIGRACRLGLHQACLDARGLTR